MSGRKRQKEGQEREGRKVGGNETKKGRKEREEGRDGGTATKGRQERKAGKEKTDGRKETRGKEGVVYPMIGRAFHSSWNR